MFTSNTDTACELGTSLFYGLLKDNILGPESALEYISYLATVIWNNQKLDIPKGALSVEEISQHNGNSIDECLWEFKFRNINYSISINQQANFKYNYSTGRVGRQPSEAKYCAGTLFDFDYHLESTFNTRVFYDYCRGLVNQCIYICGEYEYYISEHITKAVGAYAHAYKGCIHCFNNLNTSVDSNIPSSNYSKNRNIIHAMIEYEIIHELIVNISNDIEAPEGFGLIYLWKLVDTWERLHSNLLQGKRGIFGIGNPRVHPGPKLSSTPDDLKPW